MIIFVMYWNRHFDGGYFDNDSGMGYDPLDRGVQPFQTFAQAEEFADMMENKGYKVKMFAVKED
jgi:hypothetical protein